MIGLFDDEDGVEMSREDEMLLGIESIHLDQVSFYYTLSQDCSRPETVDQQAWVMSRSLRTRPAFLGIFSRAM